MFTAETEVLTAETDGRRPSGATSPSRGRNAPAGRGRELGFISWVQIGQDDDLTV